MFEKDILSEFYQHFNPMFRKLFIFLGITMLSTTATVTLENTKHKMDCTNQNREPGIRVPAVARPLNSGVMKEGKNKPFVSTVPGNRAGCFHLKLYKMNVKM